MSVELVSGATYYVGAACGVPHNFRPIKFRVIRAWQKYIDECCWLYGYELDDRGNAIAAREIYVITAGLQLIEEAPPKPAARRRPTNAAPVRLPRQRTASAEVVVSQ